MLRNFGGRNANGLRAMYERLLKLAYGFTIMASVPLIMDNFQVHRHPWSDCTVTERLSEFWAVALPSGRHVRCAPRVHSMRSRHPIMQAALLPKLAIMFPMEPGAKKGTTIQEQAITTAVLGVLC